MVMGVKFPFEPTGNLPPGKLLVICVALVASLTKRPCPSVTIILAAVHEPIVAGISVAVGVNLIVLSPKMRRTLVEKFNTPSTNVPPERVLSPLPLRVTLLQFNEESRD